MSAIILPGVAAQEIPVSGGVPIPAITNRAGGTGAHGALRKINSAKPAPLQTDNITVVFYGDHVTNNAFVRIFQIGNASANATFEIGFNYYTNGGIYCGHRELSNWGNTFNKSTTWTPTPGQSHHVVYSCNSITKVASCMIDGAVETLNDGGAGGNFTVYWGAGSWAWALFCRHDNVTAENGEFHKLGFIAASDTAEDLTSQSVRDKFWDSAQGVPVKPDATATNLFGVPSKFCIQGDEAVWRAGDASGVSGFFNEVSSPTKIVDDGTVLVAP